MVNYYPNLPENFTALDLGCGSGLLGIGAAKLGASAVLAFDFNPLACAVAKQNAAYNRVANIVLVEQVDLRIQFPATKVDLIMANLHHELLAQLFRNSSFWQAGLYILSGFMPGGEEHLLASLPGSPPPFLNRGRLDKWCVWVLGRISG